MPARIWPPVSGSVRPRGTCASGRRLSRSASSLRCWAARPALDARVNPGARTAKEQSDLVIALAPHVEDFLGDLFGISKEVEALASRGTMPFAPFFAFKRKFIQKRAISGVIEGAGGGDRRPGPGPRAGGDFRRAAHRASFFAHVSLWLEKEAEYIGADPDRRALRRVGRLV